MGATSEKLTYLNTTKTLIKEELNLGGANITNEPFRAYKDKLEGIYKDFLANGTDTLWNNWEKVTGSGETITLNNTIEAKMDFVYKGNTYQYSTTGKNLLNTTATTQTKNGLTFTRNEDDTWTINGTSTDYTSIMLGRVNLTENTTYTLSGGGLSGSYMIQALNGGTNPATGNNGYVTFTQPNTYLTAIYLVVFANKTLNNVTLKPMIELGSSVSPYEPYTNGASPNPDYPQDIQVVSGDNTLKVAGKNLFDISTITLNKTIDLANGNVNVDASNRNTSDFILVTNSVTYSCNVSMTRIAFYDENKTFISSSATMTSIVTPNNCNYVRFSYDNSLSNIQFERGYSSSFTPYATSYPISLGNIELCKIGTYQDKIAKSTGKNLFDYKTPNINQITWTPTDNGGKFTSSTYWKNLGNKLELDTTKQYTFSFGARNSDKLYYYIKTYTDETYQRVKTTIVNDGTSLSKTFTPDSKYVSIYFANGGILQNVEIPNIQLEESPTKTEFEPYLLKGTWYLNKQIGKVVLDGSKNWVKVTSTNNKRIFDYSFRTQSSYSDMESINFNYLQQTICDKAIAGQGPARGVAECIREGIECGGNKVYFAYEEYQNYTAEEFKQWVANNNITIYYKKATPTYEEITDTTLISQLEAIKKSYNNQTSISQVNNDLPFELDAVALGELEI